MGFPWGLSEIHMKYLAYVWQIVNAQSLAVFLLDFRKMISPNKNRFHFSLGSQNWAADKKSGETTHYDPTLFSWSSWKKSTRDSTWLFHYRSQKPLEVKQSRRVNNALFISCSSDSKAVHTNQAFPQTKTNLSEKYWLLFSDVSIINLHQLCNKKLI